MAKIGVYGGTFNPPHLGHILAAREISTGLGFGIYCCLCRCICRLTRSCRRTRLMPPGGWSFCAWPPRTFPRPGGRSGVPSGWASYTVETLRALKERYPHDQLYLCMGTDMLLSFDSWYHPKEICSLAQVVMPHRADAENRRWRNTLVLSKNAMGKPRSSSPMILFEISSTTVRRLLILGGAADDLDPKVYGRILELGLYGTGRNRKQPAL